MSATAHQITATELPLALRRVDVICRCGGSLRWTHTGAVVGVLVPDFHAAEPYVCTHCRRMAGQLDYDALNAAANFHRATGCWPAWSEIRGDTLAVDLEQYRAADPATILRTHRLNELGKPRHAEPMELEPWAEDRGEHVLGADEPLADWER